MPDFEYLSRITDESIRQDAPVQQTAQQAIDVAAENEIGRLTEELIQDVRTLREAQQGLSASQTLNGVDPHESYLPYAALYNGTSISPGMIIEREPEPVGIAENGNLSLGDDDGSAERKMSKFFSNVAKCPECDNAFLVGKEEIDVVCPACKHEFEIVKNPKNSDIGTVNVPDGTFGPPWLANPPAYADGGGRGGYVASTPMYTTTATTATEAMIREANLRAPGVYMRSSYEPGTTDARNHNIDF